MKKLATVRGNSSGQIVGCVRTIHGVNDRKPPLRLVRDDDGDIPLQARIHLAVSILQQRTWHEDDRRHVADVLGALLGKSIEQIVSERERCDDR